MDFFFFISNSLCRGSIITCGVTVSLNQLKQMRVGKAWLSSAAAGAAVQAAGTKPGSGLPSLGTALPRQPQRWPGPSLLDFVPLLSFLVHSPTVSDLCMSDNIM